MKKILISDKIHPECAEFLKINYFDVDYKPDLSREELLKIIHLYDGLIVKSQTEVDKEFLSFAENLELIGRAGTHVTNIDIDEATKRGIVVMNTPGGNTVSAVELTLSMMLALSRKISQADKLMKEEKWERKSLSGIELSGKTLGLIGLGSVGKEVAKRAQAFEMNVIAHDPFVSKILAYELGIELVSLNEIYKRSDFISIHTPLNSQTKYLISKNSIEKCKNGVRIINCATGGIINENDLLEALNTGKVSGAAIDVFEKEPPTNFELIKNPNFICTPHLGASTEDAKEKVARQIAEQFTEFFNGNAPIGIVNSSAVQFQNNPELKPYLSLAEKIGKLQSFFMNSTPAKLEVIIYGSKIHKYADAISSAFFKGYFEKLYGSKVNFVNSVFFAKEKSIEVSFDFKDRTQNYSNLITFSLSSSKSESVISGSVFFNLDPRIVHIDEYEVEFVPTGNMIIYYNEDAPGIMANVTTILSKNKINIAGLYLGRNQRGSNALTIMITDESTDDSIIKAISNVPGIMNLFALVLN
ncbi:MAG: phosphoglycerate dehydrogenase [Ignavibacteriales bacterium CG_4_9_14_3_um_filter_34_10]|nr:MAG: phosphoglycerate dehydrogenase [Ignavibacteriales bacterium CG_4_9_14_3_um_filter_34_10]